MATGSAVRNFPPSLNPPPLPPLKLSPSVCALSALITISGVSCGFQVSHFELRQTRIDFRSERATRTGLLFRSLRAKRGKSFVGPGSGEREWGDKRARTRKYRIDDETSAREKDATGAGGRAHLAANPPRARAAMPS